MVTRTDVEEFPHRLAAMPQRSAAWRSAVRRQANVRVTLALWGVNVALLLGDGVTHLTAAVLRL
jgi:hypothetical protein